MSYIYIIGLCIAASILFKLILKKVPTPNIAGYDISYPVIAVQKNHYRTVCKFESSKYKFIFYQENNLIIGHLYKNIGATTLKIGNHHYKKETIWQRVFQASCENLDDLEKAFTQENHDIRDFIPYIISEYGY